MGIIIKQSIKGSFWSYTGVVIGFVTTSYFFPEYLSTETIGLFSILLSYSILFSQFSALGFHAVTNRLFPFFRDKENGHNGFVSIAFLVMFVGFLVFSLGFQVFKPILIENNLEKSELFAQYVDLLFPLTFFTLLFLQLDILNKVLYDAVFGTFLQEFLQRFLIFIVTLLFIFKVLNLHQLILAYAFVVCIKGLVIFLYLLFKGELNFKLRLGFIAKKLRKEMINVALFGVLTGLGGSLVFNIDKIIINQLLGLGQTGVYAIAFFFGTLVIIPSRPLLRISGTLIADAFKKNDTDYISDIYARSCLNQFIIGSFLFGGIWININNILEILGPDYTEAKWVIFFIGMAFLFNTITGANANIISLSPFYKKSLIFIVILLILVIGTMYWLIPIMGIVGGAIAIAVSVFANNILRFLFLKVKLGMQPYDWRIVVVFIIVLIASLTVALIPKFSLILDILLRSSIFTFIVFIGIYFTKVSEDVNLTVKKALKIFLFHQE